MRRVLLITVLAAGSVMTSCSGEGVEYTESDTTSSNTGSTGSPGPGKSAGISGTVTQTMDSGGYTYVQVDTGGEQVWVASRQFPVKVGERVSFSPDMPMQDFRAESLKRSFELIYFCSAVDVEGTRYGMKSSAPPAAQPPKDAVHQKVAPQAAEKDVKLDFTGLKRPEGGKTVAEVFAERTALSGKETVLRAVVVKFTPNIMGKNWLHVRDGTGATGTDDLTVTTSGTFKVGDRVVIKGKLSVDKDFGHGYKYDVIVEDAEVRVDPVSQD